MKPIEHLELDFSPANNLVYKVHEIITRLKDLEAPVEGDKNDYTLTRGQIDGVITQLRVECADTISAQTYNKALNDLSEKLERGIM